MIILEIQDISAIKMALSAATSVLTQVIKTTKVVPEPDRWMPAIAVLIGCVLGLWYGVDLLEAILIGAGAIGLYEVTKTTIAGK